MASAGVHGFLCVDKPAGMTSNDVVVAVRRLVRARAGHGGTLDPLATGVLVIGLGEARKFLIYLRHDKTYEGRMKMGEERDTLDRQGRLTATSPVEVSDARILEVATEFVGTRELPVPLYSAVHVNGRRLHRLARSGQAAEPPIRSMTVHRLEVLAIDRPVVDFRLSCEAGVYVRSIVAAWGRALGCGAILETLVRTRSGDFELAKAFTLDRIEEMAVEGRIGEAVVPLNEGLGHMPQVQVGAEERRRLALGQTVSAARPPGESEVVRLTDPGSDFAGVGRIVPDREGRWLVKPVRLTANP